MGNFLSVAGGVLGIFGLLGGASAYFISSRSRAVIELQSQEIGALNQRLQTEEGLREGCQNRLDLVEQKADVLQGLITQVPSFTKLTQDMLDQHNRVMSELTKLVRALPIGK